MAQNCSGCGRSNPGGGLCGWCSAPPPPKPYKPKGGDNYSGHPRKK